MSWLKMFLSSSWFDKIEKEKRIRWRDALVQWRLHYTQLVGCVRVSRLQNQWLSWSKIAHSKRKRFSSFSMGKTIWMETGNLLLRKAHIDLRRRHPTICAMKFSYRCRSLRSAGVTKRGSESERWGKAQTMKNTESTQCKKNTRKFPATRRIQVQTE